MTSGSVMPASLSILARSLLTLVSCDAESVFKLTNKTQRPMTCTDQWHASMQACVQTSFCWGWLLEFGAVVAML